MSSRVNAATFSKQNAEDWFFPQTTHSFRAVVIRPQQRHTNKATALTGSYR